MQIKTMSLLSGAARAEGVAVVIDVFRAASNVAVMFSRGAECVVPVATLEEARALKSEHPDWILAGERFGLPPEGFDLGNSPYEAEKLDFTGRTIVLTTSAGSKGLVAACGSAEEVLFGCFLNASAVAAYIKNKNPQVVTFVPMGVGGELAAPEDEAAARCMASFINGETVDFESMCAAIREHPEGRKFTDPGNKNFIPEDLHACLRLDTNPVVSRMEDGRLVPA